MIEFYNEKLKERYYKLDHKSGLQIYVFPKNLSTSFAVFGTEYGSVDNCFRLRGENEYTTVPDGIAHYLEHRMFTQKDGSDITERFSACGADPNAYTSCTKTVYLCSSTDNFEEALAALFDFVTEPNFTKELVERERGIITQEIKMTDDSPYQRGYRGILEAMYEKNSVRVDIAGTVESVSQITAEMLNKCYDTFYSPNNMVAVVCGNISPEKVLEIADATLPSSFVPKEVERKYSTDESSAVFMPRYTANMEVPKPIFTIGIKDSVSISDDKERMRRYAAMAILCEMLYSRSGALYNELYESGAIASDFGGVYTSAKTFAYTAISGEADDPEYVFEYIKKHIANFSFDKEELDRCKRVLYAEYVMDFDSTDEIANNLIDYVFEGFDFFSYGDVIADISEEEINELLKSAFKDEFYAMSVIYPIEMKGE